MATIYAALAQSVARRLGKAEVGGSSPLGSFELYPGNTGKSSTSGIFSCLKIEKGAKKRQTIKFDILSYLFRNNSPF